MASEDRVILTLDGDPPRLTLSRVAARLGVDPAQVVRWAWVGRIPPPTQIGRRHLWRSSEVGAMKRCGPAMVGFYPSLPHYDGIRLLEAARVAETRRRRSPGGKRGGRK
jgi:predicted DNA-binding transcriptional regulator AlpA